MVMQLGLRADMVARQRLELVETTIAYTHKLAAV